MLFSQLGKKEALWYNHVINREGYTTVKVRKAVQLGVISVCGASLFVWSFASALAPLDPSRITNKTTHAQAQAMIDGLFLYAQETGSNMALAKMRMMERKFNLKPSAFAKQRSYYYDYPHPSSMTLIDGIYGNLATGYFTQGDFNNELDLITGKRAIDESLQLESIPSRNQRTQEEPRTIAVSGIQDLQIKSHSWKDMMLDHKYPEQSALFEIVPQDDFFVYFSDLSSATKLEDAFKKLFAFGDQFFDISQALSIKEKISRRLGIDRFENLQALVGEAAFVSEDLSFIPSTNYALILKFKTGLAGGLSKIVTADKSVSGQVGDYVILATSQRFLDTLVKASENGIPSMKDAPDLAYAMAVLEQKRDGLVYFSEKFILKLVSPEYRVNADRRWQVLQKLKDLQYVVFAYQNITGTWPSSFVQIAQEGYADGSYMEQAAKDFSIDAQGRVRHKEWGSLYDMKPVGDVAITHVTATEKNRYDSFRDGYQEFWREFFDPIGIAITVGDELYFHTIILPLIDESMYNTARTWAGGTPGVFDALTKSLRIPPALFLSKLNFDDALIATMEDSLYYEYKGDQLYESNRDEDWQTRMERQEKEKEQYLASLSREEKMRQINAMINKLLNLKGDKKIDVFGVVGNEYHVGVGQSLPSEVENIADYDVYFAVKFQSVEKAKTIINTLYRAVAEEMNSGLGLFRISSREPVKNSYNGVEYYMIPTGLVNLYYFFQGEFGYFSVSQLAVNNLIDSLQGKTPSALSAKQSRLLDYVGTNHNMLLLADLSGFENFKKGLLESSFTPGSYLASQAFNLYGYLTDIQMLEQSLPANHPQKAKDYFLTIPKEFRGVPLAVNGQSAQIGGKPFGSVDFGTMYRPSYGTPALAEGGEQIPFDQLVSEDVRAKFLADWNAFEAFSVALSFTKEGLDTRVSIKNPLMSTYDPRFGAKGYPQGRQSWTLIIGGIAAFTILWALAAVAIHRFQRRPQGPANPVTPTQPPPTNPPA